MSRQTAVFSELQRARCMRLSRSPWRRPPPPPLVYYQRRFAVSDVGDNRSGHISVTPSEGILYLNNLFPVNLQWLYKLLWIGERRFPSAKLLNEDKTTALGAVAPAQVLEDATKNGKLGISSAKVVEIIPRLKEGGAYLKFSHDEATDAATVVEAVRQHLHERQIKPWWNPLSRVSAGIVKGRPWVEDLFWTPQRRLRVEFLPTEPGAEVAELSQEQVYSFFRPYGKLADVVPQASDSKITPRFAYVDFAQIRNSIMAKSCLHGYTVNEEEGGGKTGTLLRLTYEKKQSWGWLKDWIFGHPRITIPLFVAIVGSATVAIFDPLRTFSIRTHIDRTFSLSDNKIYRWFMSQSKDLISRVGFNKGAAEDEAGMQVLWEDRKDDIEQIKSWLMETADTFIVIQGPRGSGKRELVLDRALKSKRDAHRVLVLDCKPIVEARGESSTICAAAAEVGYRPVFSWMNSISGLMDLAAQGLTGVKAGFSETLENQLGKIWNNTATALKQIALEDRKKGDKDANLSDDEWLEAHPEARPVVVIDNFLHKATEPGAALIYDKLSEWTARLTTSNLAHVVYLTNDVSYGKSLSKALPNRVFRSITLGDTTAEVAKRYVINHLAFDAVVDEKTEVAEGEEVLTLTPRQKREDLQELDDVIPLLGGRLTDLEFLARRIKAGESPSKAVREIIDASASEILKMYIFNGDDEKREWTSTQAWALIRRLAKDESLRFNEVLLLPEYADAAGDKVLSALEQAELITIQSSNGRPYSIRPGRPVYKPAFARLTEDHVLAAKLELAVLADAISGANKSIEKYEQELKLLGELPYKPVELKDRFSWLLNNIMANQAKVERCERQKGQLTQILNTEF